MTEPLTEPGRRWPGRGRWSPGWKMTLFVAPLLGLLIGLGWWQLQRAETKTRFESAYLDRISALAYEPGPQAEDFHRLKLTGHYDADRYFLLDNQTHHGSVGYGVVSVFTTNDGRHWLVNRGFVEGSAQRRLMPEVLTPEGDLTIVAVTWPRLGLLPMFSEDEWLAGWPKRIQRMDVERMAGLFNGGVARELRLEAGQGGLFVAPSLELNMPAAKHIGYAVQWFGLALALTLGYVVFGFKRHE